MCVLQVEEALEGVKNATNEQDLANRFKEFGKEMVKLNYVAARRQQVQLEAPCLLLCLSLQKLTTPDLRVTFRYREFPQENAPAGVCTLAFSASEIFKLHL